MEPTGFKIDNGWSYVFNSDEPINKRLKVIPKDETSSPEYLYKYYSMSPLNIDAVQKNYLYASGRFEINDEFDCMEHLINMDGVSDEIIIDFYFQFNHTEDEVKKNIESFRETFRLHKAINYYGGFGVVSLCDNIKSPTMWAHYASSNKGFVVKFNLTHFHENMIGPFPVNYRKDWYPVRLHEVGEALAFLYMTNIKSEHWEYEKEWRYIGTGRKMSFPRFREETELVDGRKFEYSKEAIEEIILGSGFLIGLNKKDSIDNIALVSFSVSSDVYPEIFDVSGKSCE